jgi:hypothetical protein
MPLRRLSSGSPLPGTVHEQARSRFPSGRGRQPSSVFRPHGFSPSRRVPPPSDGAPALPSLRRHRADVAYMFQHASDPGVHHVSGIPYVRRALRPSETTGSRPRDAFLPFEAFPPYTATMSGPAGEASPPQHRGKSSPSLSVARPRLASQDVHRLPSPLTVARLPWMGSCLLITSAVAQSQGFPPCPGPLCVARLPARSTRCFHGLERFHPLPRLTRLPELRAIKGDRLYVKDRSRRTALGPTLASRHARPENGF